MYISLSSSSCSTRHYPVQQSARDNGGKNGSNGLALAPFDLVPSSTFNSSPAASITVRQHIVRLIWPPCATANCQYRAHSRSSVSYSSPILTLHFLLSSFCKTSVTKWLASNAHDGVAPFTTRVILTKPSTTGTERSESSVPYELGYC